MKENIDRTNQKNIELGKGYRDNNLFDKAEHIFKGVIKNDANNSQAHFELANIYVAKKLHEMAASEYEKAIDLDNKHDLALIELSKLYWKEGKQKEAKELLERAIKVNYNNAQAHLELGKINRLLGDYSASKKEFNAFLTISPDEKISSWLNKIKEVKGKRGKLAPYRVFITWGMHYECNYKCSYCYTPKPGQKDFKKDIKHIASYPGTEKIIDAWKNVSMKYGACRIRLDGGEPSVYPDFIRLVKELSNFHKLQINTNLSFNINKFIKEIDPKNVRIDASIHPEFMNIEEFAANLNKLKERGFKVIGVFVGYPPYVDRVDSYKRKLDEIDVPFIIHPFSGSLNDKKYPAAYTDYEFDKIYGIDKKSKIESDWRKDKDDIKETVKETAKKCLMGFTYARIYPNGQAYRCCTDDGLLSLGNLFDGSFNLLEEPENCRNDNCRCWRCMVTGQEERWLSTWLDDWEMPF
ncbi:MAG: tetratricopeptide repeat protein [Elusimicrobia bacterium]|nr:tetratricopeptide repeat protein [Candidatus Liberimonas magnetica]